jgi:aryl carrier-like protein
MLSVALALAVVRELRRQAPHVVLVELQQAGPVSDWQQLVLRPSL